MWDFVLTAGCVNLTFFFLTVLHDLWHFSFPTGDQTQAPGSESAES